MTSFVWDGALRNRPPTGSNPNSSTNGVRDNSLLLSGSGNFFNKASRSSGNDSICARFTANISARERSSTDSGPVIRLSTGSLELTTKRLIHAITLRKRVQDENFLGSGWDFAGSLNRPHQPVFFNSASTSGICPVKSLVSQCSSLSHRNVRPATHRQSLVISDARRPRMQSLAGFRRPGTNRHCAGCVESWISASLFATNVWNRRLSFRMYRSTVIESLQKTILDVRKVSPFFMMSASLTASRAAWSSKRGMLSCLRGGHTGLSHHERNFNSSIREHITCVADSAKSFIGSVCENMQFYLCVSWCITA